MASYAAVLSLMNTLDHINKHPSPPISLDPEQLQSLTQNLTFFQEFFERHSSTGEEDDDVLESRIAAAAYAAEDVIETHIVDQIDHARSTSESISSVDLYGDLKRVIQDMDLIKREVMEIIQDQHHPLLQHSNSSRGAASTWQSNITPVFDDALVNQVLDKLTGQQSGLQIIPIVGMGGIEYSMPEILTQVLGQGNKESEMSEIELGEKVHQKLWGRRYLIVMDDMWNNEAFDKVRYFFPDNNNGSRIMITTRLSNLAFDLCGSQIFRLNFLDEDKSWNLLCQIVFGKELGCLIELEKIGKEIARKCKGLPLSIVVIGGLLKKSNWTRAYWEHTLQNLNLLLNLEDGEYCLQILHTSYKELPIHLKPCFLYMGIFREDKKNCVTKLIELWVAEGILKPTKDKRLEEVAEENIKEIIDRNLIIVEKLRWNGKAKVCKIHDLFRNLCLREAQKQKFLCILKHQRGLDIPQCMNMGRHSKINVSKLIKMWVAEGILRSIDDKILEEVAEKYVNELIDRNLILVDMWRWNGKPKLCNMHDLLRDLCIREAQNQRFICVLKFCRSYFPEVNLRFLSIVLRFPKLSGFPSSWFIFWNLQTLKLDNPTSWVSIMAPSEIWEMPLLRHVVINGLELPDPVYSPNGEHNLVLENLQTLSWIMNFKCSEEVVKRIPNLKKLKVKYNISELDDSEVMPNICLNNLDRLQKLESLNLNIGDNCDVEKIMRNSVSFPHSLKKLILSGTQLNWEEVTMRIGSLPLLQFLILDWDACVGDTWKTIEGQFCSLRCLKIKSCEELKYWETDSSYFPRLEILHLDGLTNLEEIPSSIGDIPTLKSIQLKYCSKSAEVSAKRIREEQKENGNEDLDIQLENERIREKQKENGNEDLDIQLENGYEEFKKYSEEGDQVVSDSYAGDEEDEEEGDQVVSDSYVEDEEDPNPTSRFLVFFCLLCKRFGCKR
ncbi:hypothetical protein ACS0TY_000164 [Phlomoides rotata]